MDKPKVGIVILNWNNYEDTRETIRAIQKQSYKNTEIVVVDGKSSDGSTKRIQKEYPKYKYIYQREDQGYSGGNNAGLKCLLTRNVDYVLSMNNDVIMKPNCIQEFVDYAEKHEEAGVVGPRMHSYSDKNMFQFSGGFVNVFQSKPVPKWMSIKKAPKKYSKPFELKKLPGACIMVKKEVIEKVGLMDPDFFLYYGDTDWQKRISDAGYKQVAIANAIAYHKISATTGRGSLKVLYYDSRDFLYYVRKHYGLLATIYCFIKSFINKSFKIIQEGENKLRRINILMIAYGHFLIGRSGKYLKI